MPSSWETLADLIGGQVVLEEHMDDIRININKLGGQVVNGTAISALNDAAEILPKWSCRAYNSGNISHASSGGWVLMTYDTESWDTGTIHDNVTNPSRFTAPVVGKYIAFGSLFWDSNATGKRGIRVKLNGTVWSENYSVSGSSTIAIATVVQMTASQYIELEGFQDSGGTRTMTAFGNFGISGGIAWIGVT